jgi:tetratricopeptide (TPR) repeat protein
MPDDFPDLPHGEQWFNEAVNSNSDSALAYIARAGFYRTKGSTKKTLADLEQAEKKDLSDPNDHLRLAEEFVYADMLDKAEQHLAAVQQVTPSSRRLWLVWAQYALKSDSKQKMREIAESGLKELSSEPWDFMPIAARLFIRADRHDRAAELISKMNQKDIAPGQVAFLEGLLALEKEQTFEAVDYLRESIELGNNMPEAKLLLSQALSHLGDNKSALRHLRDLVSERPNLVKAHLALARLLAQRRDWSESARHAAVAKQISPENV